MQQLGHREIQTHLIEVLREAHAEMPLYVLGKVGIAQEHLLGQILQGDGLVEIHLDELRDLVFSGIEFVGLLGIVVVFLVEEKIGGQHMKEFIEEAVQVDHVFALIEVLLGNDLPEDPTQLLIAFRVAAGGVAPEEDHALLHQRAKLGIGEVYAGAKEIPLRAVGVGLVHIDDEKIILIQPVLLILQGKQCRAVQDVEQFDIRMGVGRLSGLEDE